MEPLRRFCNLIFTLISKVSYCIKGFVTIMSLLIISGEIILIKIFIYSKDPKFKISKIEKFSPWLKSKCYSGVIRMNYGHMEHVIEHENEC